MDNLTRVAANLSADVAFNLSFKMTIGRITVHTCKVIAVIGLITNVLVSIKMWRLHRKNPTLQAARVMQALCTSDSICLLSLTSYAYVSNFVLRSGSVPVPLRSLFCRCSMYVIHTASAFSVWCFVVLSGMRYVAVYLPLLMHRLPRWFRTPNLFLGSVLLACAVVQLWLPATIYYNPARNDCEQRALTVHVLHLLSVVDLVFVFVLPCLAVAAVDCAVRRHHRTQKRLARMKVAEEEMVRLNAGLRRRTSSEQHSHSHSATPPPPVNGERKATRTQQITHQLRLLSVRRADRAKTTGISLAHGRYMRYKKSSRLLNRYIVLTWFDLLLTAPNVLLRLLALFNLQDAIQQNTLADLSMTVFGSVAYVAFYSQFSINWLYFGIIWPHVDASRAQSSATRTLLPTAGLASRSPGGAVPTVSTAAAAAAGTVDVMVGTGASRRQRNSVANKPSAGAAFSRTSSRKQSA